MSIDNRPDGKDTAAIRSGKITWPDVTQVAGVTGNPASLRVSINGKAPIRPKLGRNEPCWCGSGKKYKRCHLEEDVRA